MKRERPPMPPVAVCLDVAERQIRDLLDRQAALAYFVQVHLDCVNRSFSLGKCLKIALATLFEDRPRALDHDPALILRPYNPRIKDVASRYTPHAHDPDALVYREKAEHQQKTTGRKPGASRTVTTKGSDIGLKAKFAKLEKRTKASLRAKQKIPSRPFPTKTRGFR